MQNGKLNFVDVRNVKSFVTTYRYCVKLLEKLSRKIYKKIKVLSQAIDGSKIKESTV